MSFTKEKTKGVISKMYEAPQYESSDNNLDVRGKPRWREVQLKVNMGPFEELYGRVFYIDQHSMRNTEPEKRREF